MSSVAADAARPVVNRRALVVCGPTAAGKSPLADALAEVISAERGTWVPTIVVDSMQVYEEVPESTNQRRERPAEMVGIVSVEDSWTVARHKETAEGLIEDLGEGQPFVLDAGTGMYLNAIILGIELAPKVPDNVREEAMAASEGAENPRRAAREAELRIEGAAQRGSVWSGSPLYGASFVYVRPPRESLDSRIEARSARIVRDGIDEGASLLGMNPNPSVRQAVGPREMMMLASGELSAGDAERRIAARTRRLARRQMRWFDKLLRSLPEGTPKLVIEGHQDPRAEHIMHDIIGSWE